ncbi:tetratricopeptide repeat protein [Fulvivirga sp. RKSG066]|uniref:tetratricopeptide repeat protein n=1 Tax=Fulvivirga aurantia TaxID=2529383 RepID=UPI0012BD62C2|nr:tetratricopeptide repeat protein [Fulvivirga aurantia]MTI19939.1 tetratricopeptide repeat protein [Fulvivirga aurantia]
MAKVVKFPLSDNTRIGYKRVKKRKKVNLEDYGQLNMFKTPPPEAKVVEMRTHRHESDFEYALSLDEKGELDKAKEFYLRAINAKDSEADAYCNLGIIESEEKQFAKAIDSFTKSLKADPRHFEAHYNLANVYSEVGNKALAKIHYELVLEIEPEFASAYYNLGLVLALDNQFKEAIRVLKKYKILIDDDHEHVNRLINSLQKTMLSHG